MQLTIGERLVWIRKNNNPKLSQTQFAETIGLTRSAYSMYELDRVIPSEAITKLICLTYHINPRWLETGEGEPRQELVQSDLAREIRDIMTGESPFAVAVMSSLAAMPGEWWSAWEKELYREIEHIKQGDNVSRRP